MSFETFISQRAQRVKESGIRRIFHLAATMKDPINFSIGQPDFDVPEPIKQAAIQSIQKGQNGYTVTQGLPELREKILARLAPHYDQSAGVLVCSGVSGGLMLAMMTLVNPGDQVLYADPYFVSYPSLIRWLDGVPLPVSTYPDFQLDPQKIRQAITPKTKILLLNSPSNPTGVVHSAQTIRDICQIAEQHNLLIISDEIYCNLSYDGPTPSPIEYAPHRTLLIRGFSKSYGMTGWRLAYAVGPQVLINQMANVQQYSFVCAPSMAQYGGIAALDTDISELIKIYKNKRNLTARELSGHFEFPHPSGGFYFFLKIPSKFGNGTQFAEAAIKKNLLCVPGAVFSERDSHIRISYAVKDDMIRRGCEVLRQMI